MRYLGDNREQEGGDVAGEETLVERPVLYHAHEAE
jgi:hypothetical protein